MSKVNKVPILYTSILYFLGLFLFLEWLYPVQQITDTDNLIVFVIFAFFSFMITMLRVRWWIAFLLKGFGMLFIINGLFFEYSLFSTLWISDLFADIRYNLQMVFSMEWYSLSGAFRTILFLLIIWLMSYLVYYWFIVMRRIFIFIVLTIIYLTVLDTFTAYDATFSIVRTFIMALLALGMTNFFKQIQNEGIRFSWSKKAPIWTIPLIGIVLFSSIIGYAAPKFEPQWPDPIPFVEGIASGGSGSGGSVQKVGYGEDDTRLGGSFVQDFTPVFQAAVQEEHYWRIESKDVYTGKGWELQDDRNYVAQQNGFINYGVVNSSIETERLEATVNFNEGTNIPKLLYPYGVRKAEGFYDREDNPLHVSLRLDEESGEILTLIDNTDDTIPVYSILYDYPSYSRDQLRESIEVHPEILTDRYTQLPESLPDRVAELAEEITAGYDNQFDKATAIERYFSGNGFEYQTENIPVPSSDEDYVDQFLFESQVGYCDNFSTSMVVMLRTLDIPARWVKGFTSGEQVSEKISGDPSYDIYEVTNANAHSWVEVYFPDVGWVPFEPTKGFSNPSDFYTENNSNDDDFLEAPNPEMDNLEDEEQQELDNEEEDLAMEALQPTGGNGNEESLQINWWQLVIQYAIIFTILALISFIVYRYRFQIRMQWLSNKLRRKQDARTYQDAYLFMLKLLDKKGIVKEPDQTLREYAAYVDRWYRTDSMVMLTNEYEKVIYKNDPASIRFSKVKDLWENFVKQLLG